MVKGMTMPTPSRAIVALCQLLIVGCAITVLAITGAQLVNVWIYGYYGQYVYWGCAYGPLNSSMTPCNYAYALGAVSLLFSCLVACLQCCGDGCSESALEVYVLDIVCSLCLLGWWTAGGVYFTQKYWDAAGNGAPTGPNNYRMGIYAVAWAAVALAGVSTIMSGIAICNSVKDKKSAKEDPPTADQMPGQPQPAYQGYQPQPGQAPPPVPTATYS